MSLPSREDVITSAMAASWLLAQSLAPGARVLACAGPGVVEALQEDGFTVVDRGPAEAVVVGFHREFDFARLDHASSAVRAGARFIATNLDATYPVPGGLIPGAGSLVAAVATAAGSAPEVAGKPAATDRRADPGRASALSAPWWVTGHRRTARSPTALGWPFALVLSGVTQAVAPPGGEAIPDPAPPFVGADLDAVAPSLIAALERRSPTVP